MLSELIENKKLNFINMYQINYVVIINNPKRIQIVIIPKRIQIIFKIFVGMN